MRIIGAAVLVSGLAIVGTAWAADTDVENPALRELPLQRGPIVGGHQHQPTAAEVEERLQTKSAPTGSGPDTGGAPAARTDELYQRVLKQSQHATPRVITPDQ